MRGIGWFIRQKRIGSIAFGEQNSIRSVPQEFLVARCIVGRHEQRSWAGAPLHFPALQQ
jgi:hypothetical protein